MLKSSSQIGNDCENSEWVELPEAPIFKESKEIYEIVKHLPLYRRKNKEEVFLGIRKSKYKHWIGWDYISQIRKDPNFDKLLISLGLYELALNFWIFQCESGVDISFEHLLKQYEF